MTSQTEPGTAPVPSFPRPLAVRRAGVLLHVTSLPRTHPDDDRPGSGSLGASAYRFVDLLHDAGCTVWQVLPLVPTHTGDRSPYNAVSAMAGNPELVDLDPLVEQELLTEDEAADARAGRATPADARALAAHRFADRGGDPAFDAWCAANAHWLDTFVEFVALRESLGRAAWPTWEPPLRDRDPAAVAEALAAHAPRVLSLRFEQWLFATQWAALKQYAAERGVLFFGDLPIFVSLDSADVWGFRELFLLDEEGTPSTVTGVPPDYFSADGQRWNNPHYDWDRMAEDGYAWWRLRIARQRELFDLVRIDHFRGFQAAWHVPAAAETAREGRWVESPGRQVLTALIEEAGEGTLVAEDLGTITHEVVALRDEFGLPGMKILHFAFDGDPHNFYLPEHHGRQAVVYTGTHDNDTTAGWWAGQDDAVRDRARRYTLPSEEMPWALVRTALASDAVLAVVPAQDLLGLGSESRMNTPGSASGNWTWQADETLFDPALARRLRELVVAHGRLPGS